MWGEVLEEVLDGFTVKKRKLTGFFCFVLFKKIFLMTEQCGVQQRT